MRPYAAALFLALQLAVADAVLMEGVRQAVSRVLGVHSHHKLQCGDCMQLASEVDGRLSKPPDVESDDVNIAAGPGRRSHMVHFKEPEIDAALDVACDLLAASTDLAEGVVDDCRRLIAAHKHALNDAIFSGGTSELMDTMCVNLFGVCDPHTITGGGEL